MRSVVLSILAFATVGSATAWAHHGFDGRYDISRPTWVEGVVTRAYFGQPHAVLSIRLPRNLALPARAPDLVGASNVIDVRRLQLRPGTPGQVLRIELPPTSSFFALNRSVRVGDRVAAIVIRNCEAPNQLYAQWVRPARGTPVAQGVRMRFMAQGC